MLTSVARAYNAVVAGWREITAIRDELLSLTPQQPPAARRSRPVPAASAGQGAPLPAGGRRR
ncbi:hypothetical protein [Kitasatospora sp. NPDC057015]|uniref:hypothetical protein n=1 Tax=Kitasatospora sp. NPDC057015 TaxID=3346001 RepID=UPI00362981A9